MRNIVKELAELTDAMKDSDMSESMIRESSDMLIIEAAVQAADEILMEFTDGSVEHIDLLTAAVSARFCDKVFMSQSARRNRQLLLENTKCENLKSFPHRPLSEKKQNT